MATKAPTVARGYDYAHRTERARWAALVKAGGAVCCLCGQPVVDGKVRLRNGRVISNWALDHAPDGLSYRGVAHLRCNSRDGAIRGNRRRGARARLLRAIGNPSRSW